MAGDWIPIQVDLPRRREVLAIATATGRSRHEVVGLLVEFWGWVSSETDVDELVDVSVSTIPVVGADDEFWRAVVRVGWLVETEIGLRIPNFDHWMSDGAKSRLRKTLRQKRWRGKPTTVDASAPAGVDASAPAGVDVSVSTTEEKSTEEKSTEEKSTEEKSTEEKSTEEKKKQRSVELKGSTAVDSQDVDVVIKHYQQQHPRSRPGKKERALICARLKDGYSVDDLKAAIDGCHRSPYHCGENDRGGKKFQSLELIVRDSSHVNQFLEIPIGGAEPVLSERTRRNMRAAQAFTEREARNGLF